MSTESTEDDLHVSSDEMMDQYKGTPGKCVIISNTKFPELPNLPEGEIDQQSLLVLFTLLKFEVKIHKNKTAADLVDIVESYSKVKHRGVFVLAVLSHGGDGVVYGTDKQPVEIAAFEKMFSSQNCPTLTGVPKIILIDACRGTTKTDNDQISSNKTKGDQQKGKLPNKIGEGADFAIVYPTTRGKEAYIETDKGSILTQAFVDEVKGADPSDSFRTIMDRVKRRVEPQQTVEVVDRLRKHYYMQQRSVLFEIQEKQKEINEPTKLWIPIRKITIELINNVIEKLIEYRRNANRARIGGSAISIIGGVMTIAGFALSPVTLGASFVLTAGGIAMATAGGAAAMIVSFNEFKTQKSNLEHTQEQLKRDYDELQNITKMVKELKEIIDDAEEKIPNIDEKTLTMQMIGSSAVRAGTIATKLGEMAIVKGLGTGALAVRVGGTAVKVIAIAGLVFNVAAIPIDIIEIVRSGWNIKQGNESQAVVELRKLVSDLENQKAIMESVCPLNE